MSSPFCSQGHYAAEVVFPYEGDKTGMNTEAYGRTAKAVSPFAVLVNLRGV